MKNKKTENKNESSAKRETAMATLSASSMPAILKSLLPIIQPLLPVLLVYEGNKMKESDANATGADDAFGNVLIDLAPAVAAYGAKDESAAKAAARAARDTLNLYLGE